MKRLLSLANLLLAATSIFAQETPMWMRNAAISPDGQTVAFSYKGDLYTVPSSGGTARPLTVHEAIDVEPVWSHDGTMIAFASNRYGNNDVYLVPASGGEEIRLTFNSAGDSPSDFSIDNKHIIFSSSRLDDASNQQFPSGVLSELYSVPVTGGRVTQVMTTPAVDAKYSPDGSQLIFHDRKGYEDDFRKHHTSSVTRDIWSYTIADGSYKMVSSFDGEDRTPLFSQDGTSMYYLSEVSGSFNVHKMSLKSKTTSQLTKLSKHPVRSLSMSSNGTMCFSYHGELYLLKEGAAIQKMEIDIRNGSRTNATATKSVRNAQEIAVSPNGKEVAFIHRGEVFVTSVKEGTTKRITSTPEQERSIDFSPDGRAILYASERNGSWNLYQSKIAREEETYFFNSTLVNEEVLLESAQETFQPSYSTDGKEVAFLEQRTALKVINIASKEVREIMPANRQYSYSDGDQHYDWSPDGKWFLVGFLQDKQWIDQAGLVSADGKGEIVNLTKSGYGAYGAQWMMEGKMMMYFSSKDGMKNHASWGGESDVYAMFFTQEAYDEFMLSEEDFELKKEASKEEGEEEEDEDDKKKKKGKKGKDQEEKPEMEPIKIELDGIEDRMRRLTIHSSQVSDAYVSNDGGLLFYLTRFEKGYDLWQTNLRTRETKVLAKLGQGGGSIVPDKKGENLFVLANGSVQKIDIKSGKPSPVKINGEMILDEAGEREYLFEHVWRQVREKFYVKDLQGVDWDFYKAEYAKLLPSINNNHDFAEMLAEMLGELNASHTGARYFEGMENSDQTASFGLFYDQQWTGDGLKITEVMDKSPVVKEDSKIKAGVIIEKINGNTLTTDVNEFQFMNRIAGKPTLLSLYNTKTKERWEETVKPIGRGMEYQLRYERWVKNCRAIVDELSNGEIGYVHVRGMNDYSYRTVYDEALGRNHDKRALIVDTRFNGGGWLHDDLATFLSGKDYITFMPRGQNLGNEPQFKWRKPSCVVMSESNYSDAHMFPYTYKALGIGQLIGMPVPGTGTAVWWERLQNGVVFGIPQVGMVDVDGDYLENKQLEPDVKVANEPGVVTEGRDQQLEEAVNALSN